MASGKKPTKKQREGTETESDNDTIQHSKSGSNNNDDKEEEDEVDYSGEMPRELFIPRKMPATTKGK